jgi:hypothetical protein
MTEPQVDPLPAPIRERFATLAHAGTLPAGLAPALVGEAGQVAEGTWVRLALAAADGRIVAARFAAYGCPWLLAACDWLCERLEGSPWPGTPASRVPGATAGQGGPDAQPPLPPGLGGPLDWATRLGVPQARLTRLLVLEDALRAAWQFPAVATG